MNKITYLLSLSLVLFLSACGVNPASTPAVRDIETLTESSYGALAENGSQAAILLFEPSSAVDTQLTDAQLSLQLKDIVTANHVEGFKISTHYGVSDAMEQHQNALILFHLVLQNLKLSTTDIYLVPTDQEYRVYKQELSDAGDSLYFPIDYKQSGEALTQKLKTIIHELYHVSNWQYKRGEELPLQEEYAAHRLGFCFAYWAGITRDSRFKKYSVNASSDAIKRDKSLKHSLSYSVTGLEMVIEHFNQIRDPYCDYVFPQQIDRESVKRQLLESNEAQLEH